MKKLLIGLSILTFLLLPGKGVIANQDDKDIKEKITLNTKSEKEKNKKAEITKITINDKEFTDKIEEVEFPYEIKIYTSKKADENSSISTQIKVLSKTYYEVKNDIKVYENYISLKPREALLNGQEYRLKIEDFLKSVEKRTEYFSNTLKKELKFKISNDLKEDLKLEKALINDDYNKDIIKNKDYKLTSSDTKISLYFNQPVSLEKFEKSVVDYNGKGIHINKENEKSYLDTARLTDEIFELIQENGKYKSKITFTMVGKLTYEDSLREPLAKNSKYTITIEDSIKNADKKSLSENKTLTLNTGDLEAKKWKLEIKDAKFIEPKNDGKEIEIVGGTKVVLEAPQKEGYVFTHWSDPHYLEKEFPKLYKEIIEKRNNKKLEFTMPNTDLYIYPEYKKINNKKGWVDLENSWYYIDNNGNMLKSEWIYDKKYSSWYYLNDNGKMAKSEWIYDKKYSSWYYLNDNGKMAKSEWIYDKKYSSWYYLNDNGKMAKSEWIYDKKYSSWYYLNDNGKMAKSEWIYDKKYASWYYLNDNGKMAKSQWVKHTDNEWYYLLDNGKMAKSMLIDKWKVNSKGIWVR
ncbi:N-acetylmuramoyl-L-alanine amidase family protein [Helcococcus ovis]|uniref:N-acetylmuramoyl-L-alanine amidase family protein n=1 Tax=Helcococcus ovis TaxID=72026 RepID=UPI00106FA2F6|nr:N-acetylmuramoyl-L-alanine amidase family protein [Helcococcus ovis]TFF68865.1 N-acetylmuramoyl-L-alanine amidase family protein [Helcococcus ovis]WNZ00705.1 N-acetylmuramoyl-L-alanine amidase family protein [Helcococcus ovis]